MNKITIFIVILLISLGLGALDFFVNGYGDKINLTASVENLSKLNNTYTKLLKKTDQDIELAEQKETKDIFSKVNLEKIQGINKGEELLFTKNNVNYFKLYTFEFESSQNQVNYLKIKEMFNNLSKSQPHITINEVNNYGANSFYVNNTQEESMARIIILTSTSVFGIEYSKAINKESIEPLLSILTTSNTI